jgi:hypothetical protein
MKRMHGWLLCAAALAVQCRHESEPAPEAEHAAASVVADEHGDNVVELDRETVQRLGIEVRALETSNSAPVVVAYGRLAADPARTWDLRAPIAGTLRADAANWPSLGAALADGAKVGSIDPRLSAAERVDLSTKTATARGEQESAKVALANAQLALARARTLNEQGKNVSDRALQDAQAAVDAERARLATAEAQEKLATAVLGGSSEAFAGVPLELAHGGEVVEVAAHPGEAVEPGALLLRVARFDELLAEIELPIGAAVDVKSMRVVALAHPDHPLDAELVARDPRPDAAAPGARVVARVRAEDLELRPGEAVTAYARAASTAVEGTVVPRSAVVRFAGKAWAYAQIADGSFARRELALDAPREDGWFTSAAWARGASVVVAGAQTLLSSEMLNAQLRSESDE